MANRLALRDLQARLATRLEKAREGAAVTGWLAVEAGSHGFLLPLTQAGEIFPWTLVQRVPYTDDWFIGVVNLRGGLYSVVDMHHFLFGQSAARRNELTQSQSQSRFVAFNVALELNCVMVFDRLAGLRNVQSFAHELEVTDDRPGFYGTVLVDAQGRQWQELDLQKLAADAHFLTIGAHSAATH